MLEKVELAFKHKDRLVRLRQAHQELLEAEVWLLEAVSDVETLKDRNKDIQLQLQQATHTALKASEDCDVAKDDAHRILAMIRDLNLDDDEQEIVENLAREYRTEEEVNALIVAEEAFLESHFTSNPNARKEYEKYQANIAKLERSIEESTGKLETYAAEIAVVKERWEPALDELVSKISEEFSYNFEQIGCAGEVSVHKDDDFEEWALEIKVKFRSAKQ